MNEKRDPPQEPKAGAHLLHRPSATVANACLAGYIPAIFKSPHETIVPIASGDW